MILYFENHIRCLYAKTYIEEARRQLKIYEISLLASFLESAEIDI